MKLKHSFLIKSIFSASALLSAFAFTSCSFLKKSKNGASSKGIDTSRHVIITYMTTGDRPTNGATERMLKKLNEILTEKVNAELQIYYIPWSDYLVKYNTELSQLDGEIDLVGTASDWLDAWQNAKNGTFLGMDDEMVKTYAPLTYESVSSEHWDMCRSDGKIYLLPEDNYAQWINHGFMYRGDWAKAAGLSSGVNSWEDMTTYFKYLRTTYPSMTLWDSAGGTDTYQAFGYIRSKSDFVELEGITTGNLFGVRKGDLKKVYSPYYDGNELIEYAKLMKEWDNMHVWPENVLNRTDHADSRGNFKKGLTAVEAHHTQTWYTEVRPELDENIPGSDCQFFWFGKESGNITEMTITHGAMAISAASANPERALMVYDLIRNDPQCYYLMNYGIEGVQWRKTPAGKRARPASYNSTTDGITTNYWWGRNDKLEIRDEKGAWDMFDKISSEYNTKKIPYPYGQVIWSFDNISKELTAVSDVWGHYMGKICYGKVDNPEAYVADFRRDLKNAGIEKIIRDLQSQLDNYNNKK